MSVGEIVSLVVAIVSILPTLVSVAALIVNIVKNKNWKLVMSIADEAMDVVEKYSREHPGMTSDQKLEMAIKAIKSGLAVAGIKVDEELLKRIADYVKQSINWHNGMNGEE